MLKGVGICGEQEQIAFIGKIVDLLGKRRI